MVFDYELLSDSNSQRSKSARQRSSQQPGSGTGWSPAQSKNVIRLKNKKSGATRVGVRIWKESLVTTDGEKVAHHLESLRKLEHVNICRMFETYEDRKCLFLIYEYCGGGSLLDRVMSSDSFSEMDASRVAGQLLDALFASHAQEIRHGAWDARFLLCSHADWRQSYFKIANFGLRSKLLRGQSADAVRSAAALHFAAPESLGSSDVHAAADLWSVGSIVYMLLLGHPPISGARSQRELVNKIKSGEWRFGYQAEGLSANAKDFIRRLLCKVPKDRLTASEALGHPWLKRARKTQNTQVTATISADVLRNLRSFQQESKVVKTAMKWMVSNLPKNAIRDLERVFKKMDRNSDGHLTLAELRDGMLAFPDVSLPPDFETLFMELEQAKGIKEGEGAGEVGLSIDEFIAATMDAKLLRTEEVLWSTFQRFDLDGSGALSKTELHVVLKEVEGSIGPDEVHELLTAVDSSKDKELSFEELVDFLYGAGKKEREASALATVDDGYTPRDGATCWRAGYCSAVQS